MSERRVLIRCTTSPTPTIIRKAGAGSIRTPAPTATPFSRSTIAPAKPPGATNGPAAVGSPTISPPRADCCSPATGRTWSHSMPPKARSSGTRRSWPHPAAVRLPTCTTDSSTWSSPPAMACTRSASTRDTGERRAMGTELRRKTPEELLRELQAEENPPTRGYLKIFLGYASGVGKSFRMLDEARRRRERGQDVIVGAVQPKVPRAVAGVLEKLEVIPLKTVGDGTAMDVETILSRAPTVCFIDGLAYDN